MFALLHHDGVLALLFRGGALLFDYLCAAMLQYCALLVGGALKLLIYPPKGAASVALGKVLASVRKWL